MKKLMIVLACVLALGASSTSVSAIPLTIGDAYYVGRINDGIPSAETKEIGYVNTLITLAAGQAETDIGTETYDRLGSTLTSLPLATSYSPHGGVYVDINVATYAYILGKYDQNDAGSYVWYISGLNYVSLPLYAPSGHEVSHYTLFTNGDFQTPDGGMTLMLLGGALVGLGALRRKFRG
jgi:hypothetical protein